MSAALAGSALAIAAPAPTSLVWVQVASRLDCPRPSAVLVALRARLGAARVRTGEAPSGSLVLRVEPHGRRGVSAILEQAGEVIVERTIEADAKECAGLAETVALVTETWLPAPPGSAPIRPESTAAESTAAESTVEASRTSATDTSLNERDEARRSVPGAAAVDAERSPTAGGASGEPLEGSANGGARHAGLALELAIGSAFALDVSAVALLRMGVELSFEPWRIGLRGQLETAGALDSSGSISIRHSVIEGVIGADVYRSGKFALATLLAAGADVLSVSASSYSRSAPASLVEPIAALGLRAEWRALESLGLTAGADGMVALRRERFLADLDTVTYTPRTRARISIGALWHLF